MTRLTEGWETRSQSFYFAPRALKQITDAFNESDANIIYVVVGGRRELEHVLCLLASALCNGDVGLYVPTQFLAEVTLQATAGQVNAVWGCAPRYVKWKRVVFNHTDDPELATYVWCLYPGMRASRGYSQVDTFLVCRHADFQTEITNTEWMYTLALYSKQGTRVLIVEDARWFDEQQFLSTQNDASTKIIRL
jgi:hypothetical protein